MPTSKARKRRLKYSERQKTKKMMKLLDDKECLYTKAPASIDVGMASSSLRWPYLVSVSPSNMYVDDADVSPSAESSPLDLGPDPSGWFTLQPISLRPVWDLWTWCYSGLFQGVETVKDTLLPSRHYMRELRDTLVKVQQIEEELMVLKGNSLKGNEINHGNCRCQCQSSGDNSRDQVSFPVQDTIPIVVALPPPPPPPPPPPQAKSQQSIKDIIKRNGPGKSLGVRKAVVTLTDIQNVKLKKTDRGCNTSTGKAKNDEIQGRALVTLDDLKNMQLKKIKSQAKAVAFDTMAEARKRLPQEVLMFQKNLKKVNMKRSPGGTPFVDRQLSMETGEGLTPTLTRALKKKFLFARSPSSQQKRISSKSPLASGEKENPPFL